jgi:hypothetical protein
MLYEYSKNCKNFVLHEALDFSDSEFLESQESQKFIKFRDPRCVSIETMIQGDESAATQWAHHTIPESERTSQAGSSIDTNSQGDDSTTTQEPHRTSPEIELTPQTEKTERFHGS